MNARRTNENKLAACLFMADRLAYSSTLKTDAVCSSDTSANFYKTAWRHMKYNILYLNMILNATLFFIFPLYLIINKLQRNLLSMIRRVSILIEPSSEVKSILILQCILSRFSQYYSCIIRVYKKNSVVLVRERIIPTQRPPLVGEVSARFCG
jgi:hypothetical protein